MPLFGLLNLNLTPTPPHSSSFLLPQGPSCVPVIPNPVPPLFLCPSQGSAPTLSHPFSRPASPFLEPLSTGSTHAPASSTLAGSQYRLAPPLESLCVAKPWVLGPGIEGESSELLPSDAGVPPTAQVGAERLRTWYLSGHRRPWLCFASRPMPSVPRCTLVTPTQVESLPGWESPLEIG